MKSGKPYWEAFADHAFRFYIRNPSLPENTSEADRQNWQICSEIYGGADARTRKMLDAVYGFSLPFRTAVNYAAHVIGTEENEVWRTINRFQRRFAERRGLK